MSVNPAIQQIAREIDITALRAMLRADADHQAHRRSQLCRVLRWTPAVCVFAALVWWVVG